MLVVPEAPGIFHGFFIRHMLLVALGTILCLVVGLAQVRRGLASFAELRSRLIGVRAGRDKRLEGAYPAEVAPSVTDLHVLLTDREHRLRRALMKAADIAHGLNTPLPVIKQLVD